MHPVVNWRLCYSDGCCQGNHLPCHYTLKTTLLCLNWAHHNGESHSIYRRWKGWEAQNLKTICQWTEDRSYCTHQNDSLLHSDPLYKRGKGNIEQMFVPLLVLTETSLQQL